MGMVRDMSNILNLRQRFAPRYAAMRMGARGGAGSSAATAANCSGAVGDDDNSSDDGWEVVEADELAGPSGAGGAGGTAKVEEAEGGSGGVKTEGEMEVEMEVEEEAIASGGVGAPAPLGLGPTATKAALLRKRLREEASPKADEGVWARVQQEMQSRGGFQALMPLFPVRSAPAAGGRAAAAGEGSLPWDKQDFKLPAMMRKFSRQEVRAAQAQQQPQVASKQARTSLDTAAP